MKHANELMMPHGHCYLWQEELLWTHVISDGLIAIAYALVTGGIVYITLKRKDLKFDWMFYLFALVFISCGATHAISIWAVWEPIFYMQGSFKVLTAAASLGTALLMLPLLPKIVAIPSFAEKNELNRKLQDESHDHEIARREMEVQAEKLARSIEVELAESNLASAVELNLGYFSESTRKVQKPLINAVGDILRSISHIKANRQEEAIDLLSRSIRTLDDILDSVKSMVSTAGLGRWEPVFEETDIKGLVDDMSDGWREQGWIDSTEIQGTTPVLKMDSIGFRMALNDCVNAIRTSVSGKIDRIILAVTPVGFSEHLRQPVWSFRIISGAANFGSLRTVPSLESSRISFDILSKVIEEHHGHFQELYEGSELVGVEFELPYTLDAGSGTESA